jgi:hypothetical protein
MIGVVDGVSDALAGVRTVGGAGGVFIVQGLVCSAIMARHLLLKLRHMRHDCQEQKRPGIIEAYYFLDYCHKF